MSAAVARMMNGNRKLVAFGIYVAAYCLLALWGVKARMVFEGLTYGLVIVVLGNAAEHAAKVRATRATNVSDKAAP